jgi:AraC-like DNA-binding protein
MLLRSMPDVSPGNTAFRAWFYARWGRENCIILGRTRFAEYPPFSQRLSIKTARGGAERYFLGHRSVAVDDDNFLILNDGATYASRLHADREMESFSIFFRPGLVEDVRGALAATGDGVLDGDARAARPAEFIERLYPHDSLISPVLSQIREHLALGLDDEDWYEERLQVLAARLLVHHAQVRADALRLDAHKSSTRTELQRRIALATDHIHSSYDRPLGLAELAAVACLSRYHFLRLFTRVHGVTPHAYLQRKRAEVASRLLAATDLPAGDVAARVGYTSRSGLLRGLRRWTGRNPRALRRELRGHAAPGAA